MQTELRVVRRGYPDDVPLSFTVTKAEPFSPGDSYLRFGCDAWCSVSTFNANVSRLRLFANQMLDGEEKHLNLVFGADGAGAHLPRHPGSCTLDVRVNPRGRVVVSIALVSLSPAISSSLLCDSCVIHFSTDPGCLDDFIDQLEQSPTDQLHALLWGRETID